MRDVGRVFGATVLSLALHAGFGLGLREIRFAPAVLVDDSPLFVSLVEPVVAHPASPAARTPGWPPAPTSDLPGTSRSEQTPPPAPGSGELPAPIASPRSAVSPPPSPPPPATPRLEPPAPAPPAAPAERPVASAAPAASPPGPVTPRSIASAPAEAPVPAPPGTAPAPPAPAPPLAAAGPAVRPGGAPSPLARSEDWSGGAGPGGGGEAPTRVSEGPAAGAGGGGRAAALAAGPAASGVVGDSATSGSLEIAALPYGARPGAIPAEYEGYVRAFRRRIQERLRYPWLAVRQGLQGVVELEVRLDASGRLTEVAVVGREPAWALRDAALQAVRDATPFPPPAGLTARALTIRLPVVFELR